jgi:hypothetical protein
VVQCHAELGGETTGMLRAGLLLPVIHREQGDYRGVMQQGFFCSLSTHMICSD